MEETRRDPPFAAPEHAMLNAFLDYYQKTIPLKIAGLSEAELRRSLVPSGITLLGMVKHLAYVHRWWFRVVFAGEDVYLPHSEEDPDVDWRVDPDETAEQVLEFYWTEVGWARDIAQAGSLEEIGRRPKAEPTLRWIMIHMIEELARHAGHADIFREQIDGVTGE